MAIAEEGGKNESYPPSKRVYLATRCLKHLGSFAFANNYVQMMRHVAWKKS